MTDGRLGAARIVVWISMALTVPYLLLFGGTLNFLAWPGGRIVLHVILVITCAMALALAMRRPEIVRSPVVVAGALFVVAGVVSAITSQRPAASAEAAALLVLSGPCYLAIRAVAWDEPLTSRIRWLAVVCAFLVLIPYIAQILLAWLAWWGAVGPSLPPIRPALIGGVAGNPNAMATYTYLLAPYAAWACWSWRRGRAIASILVVCAAFTLITTGSRGAWLGAAAGLAICGVLIAIDHRRSFHLSRRRMAVIVIVGLLGIAALSPWFITRFAGGDASRLELWSAAISIFGQYPLTGGGPGSWQGLRLLEPIIDPHTVALLTPHDSVLYVAAEMGIAGLVTAAVLVAAIAVVAWRAFAMGGIARRSEVAVVVGSLTALGVHSLFDPGFHLAAVMLLTAFLIARMDGPIGATQTTRNTRWPVVTVAGAAMIIAALVLVRVDSAMLAADAGVKAIDDARWATALSSFDSALSTHGLGTYELDRAIALSRIDRMADAVEALERQAATEPLTSAYASAALLLEPSDPVRAAHLARAVDAAGAYDPTATLNAAGVLDRQSDPRAAEMIADALVAVPFLRLDPLPAGPVSAVTWRSGIDRAIERLEAVDPFSAANLALETGDLDRARRVAATAPDGNDRLLFEMYAAALDGSDPDMEAARRAVVESPSAYAIVWFARLAYMTGSAHDVDLARVISTTTGSGSPFGTTTVDVADDPQQLGVARLPTYPTAISYRVGPQRPYVAGMAALAYGTWQPPLR